MARSPASKPVDALFLAQQVWSCEILCRFCQVKARYSFELWPPLKRKPPAISHTCRESGARRLIHQLSIILRLYGRVTLTGPLFMTCPLENKEVAPIVTDQSCPFEMIGNLADAGAASA